MILLGFQEERATHLIACLAVMALPIACSGQSSPTPAPQSPQSPAASPSAANAGNPATLFEFQVERPAVRNPKTGSPRKPASETGESRVLVQFVVDTTGVPLMRTFAVLKTTSDSSSLAVREALRTIRYYPAEVGGRKVYQLVQEEFVF